MVFHANDYHGIAVSVSHGTAVAVVIWHTHGGAPHGPRYDCRRNPVGVHGGPWGFMALP